MSPRSLAPAGSYSLLVLSDLSGRLVTSRRIFPRVLSHSLYVMFMARSNTLLHFLMLLSFIVMI